METVGDSLIYSFWRVTKLLGTLEDARVNFATCKCNQTRCGDGSPDLLKSEQAIKFSNNLLIKYILFVCLGLLLVERSGTATGRNGPWSAPGLQPSWLLYAMSAALHPHPGLAQTEYYRPVTTSKYRCGELQPSHTTAEYHCRLSISQLPNWIQMCSSRESS